mgnify:FL=1
MVSGDLYLVLIAYVFCYNNIFLDYYDDGYGAADPYAAADPYSDPYAAPAATG